MLKVLRKLLRPSTIGRSLGLKDSRSSGSGWVALGLAPPLLWLGYSAFVLNHRRRLGPAIDAPVRTLDTPRWGRLSYYADETAPQNTRPLILIHSINAGASAYEMRPLFERLRGQRPVYALDLPGFGLSARADRAYTPQLYAEVIADFTDAVAGPQGGGADVVALSLSCEFAARAAVDRPDLFRSLVLISPTGFQSLRRGKSSAAIRRAVGQQAGIKDPADVAYNILSYPLISQAYYDLVVSRPLLYYFLRKSFEGPVDRGLFDYDYDSSHQPGARHAPLYFVAGKLFTRYVREAVYARLQQPVLVLYDRDGYVSFEELPAFRQRRDNWTTARISPTRGLPQFDQPLDTVHTIVDFHRGLDSRPAPVDAAGSGASAEPLPPLTSAAAVGDSPTPASSPASLGPSLDPTSAVPPPPPVPRKKKAQPGSPQ